jgi:hypothetical protein
MASNIQPQYFLTVFPEFKKVDPATLDAYLDIATLRVPSRVWGQSTNYATALLCAHILTAQGRGGQGAAGGATTAEQVGDLSRSFQYIAEVGSGDSWLATTRYGIDFIALRNETVIGVMPTGRARPPIGYSC